MRGQRVVTTTVFSSGREARRDTVLTHHGKGALQAAGALQTVKSSKGKDGRKAEDVEKLSREESFLLRSHSDNKKVLLWSTGNTKKGKSNIFRNMQGSQALKIFVLVFHSM